VWVQGQGRSAEGAVRLLLLLTSLLLSLLLLAILQLLLALLQLLLVLLQIALCVQQHGKGDTQNNTARTLLIWQLLKDGLLLMHSFEFT
jgi:hypothetical protein